MSRIIKVTSPSVFQGILDSNPLVVVSFTAPERCMPCRQLAPHFLAASKAADAVFVEVDVDKSPLREAYDIMAVPTVKVFKNGEYVRDLTGRTSIALLGEIKGV